MRRHYGPERTMAEFRASLDVADAPAAIAVSPGTAAAAAS